MAVLLLTSWKGRLLGGLLVSAVVTNVVWSGLLAYELYEQPYDFGQNAFIEWIRYALWIVFILKLLDFLHSGAGTARQSERRWIPIISITSLILTLGATVYLEYFALDMWAVTKTYYHSIVNLSLSLVGLMLTEQLFRNSRLEKRWSIKYLFLGLLTLFGYDFLLYADATLFKMLDENLWLARGYVSSIATPLLAIAAARNRKWSVDVFVSRKLVFYSASLMGAGLYLLVMAAAGYYIQRYGGDWGDVFRTVFMFVAVILLVLLLFSDTLRAYIKLNLSKHFFRYKYDYREEWLKLTEKMSQSAIGSDLHKLVIRSLADIMECSGGMLWLREDAIGYVCMAHRNVDAPSHMFALNDPLIRMLREKSEIIDIYQQRTNGQEDSADVPDWLYKMKKPWLLIPLLHQDELLGFVILNKSRVDRKINWEDRDLLNAASFHVASYLAFWQATETLKQGDQFAAFNRLSSFVVHDLKNLIMQLGLVVRNSERFRDNPEFYKDAFKTVKNATYKMQRLLEQLAKGRFAIQKSEVLVLEHMLEQVISEFSGYKPVPKLKSSLTDERVAASRDRFVSVLGHLIRNALEATDEYGMVLVRAEQLGDGLVISIEDTGHGMDIDFIREKLFKPFETTKGNAGMGVGVYESREFIQSIGGKMEVMSAPGSGTTISVTLPRYEQDKPEEGGV